MIRMPELIIGAAIVLVIVGTTQVQDGGTPPATKNSIGFTSSPKTFVQTSTAWPGFANVYATGSIIGILTVTSPTARAAPDLR